MIRVVEPVRQVSPGVVDQQRSIRIHITDVDRVAGIAGQVYIDIRPYPLCPVIVVMSVRSDRVIIHVPVIFEFRSGIIKYRNIDLAGI